MRSAIRRRTRMSSKNLSKRLLMSAIRPPEQALAYKMLNNENKKFIFAFERKNNIFSSPNFDERIWSARSSIASASGVSKVEVS